MCSQMKKEKYPDETTLTVNKQAKKMQLPKENKQLVDAREDDKKYEHLRCC